MLAKIFEFIRLALVKIMVHPIAPFAVCYLTELCSAADEGRGQVTLPPRGAVSGSYSSCTCQGRTPWTMVDSHTNQIISDPSWDRLIQQHCLIRQTSRVGYFVIQY